VLESFLEICEYRVFSDILLLCVCVCARSLTKPFFCPSQPGSCAWLSAFLLCAHCTCVLVCVCFSTWVHIGRTANLIACNCMLSHHLYTTYWNSGVSSELLQSSSISHTLRSHTTESGPRRPRSSTTHTTLIQEPIQRQAQATVAHSLS